MRKTKPTYFVCAGVQAGKLRFLQTSSLTRLDAIYDFKKTFGFEPEDISGPFLSRRENSKRKLKGIKFSNISYSAIYDGWNIVVNELVDPKNYVWATFEDRIDGDNQKEPSEKIIPIRRIERKELDYEE